jgi:hypothetical protein
MIHQERSIVDGDFQAALDNQRTFHMVDAPLGTAPVVRATARSLFFLYVLDHEAVLPMANGLHLEDEVPFDRIGDAR